MTTGPLRRDERARRPTISAPNGRGSARLSFRALALALALALVFLFAPGGVVPCRAEDLAIPAQIQAELVGKLAPYDRAFAERAGAKVVIAIASKTSDVDSARAAAQIRVALSRLGTIGGLPHEEVMVPWSGARNMAERCSKLGASILYLAPGLVGEIASLAKELEGRNVLTVASVLPYVAKGAVLGFELVSGRTKLVINLAQAKKQRVLFRAEVLTLMRIVQ